MKHPIASASAAAGAVASLTEGARAASQTQPVQTSPQTLRVLAWAKLNLSLHLLGREQGGYHRLESVVVFLPCHNVVTLHAHALPTGPSEDLPSAARREALHTARPKHAVDLPTTQFSGPYRHQVPTHDNSITHALQMLAAMHAEPLHGATTDTNTDAATAHNAPTPALQCVHVEKHIPAGAGLGSASADAAALIRGWHTWHAPNSAPASGDGYAGLGSDVPACIRATSCVLTGIGTDITACAVPHFPIVVVYPDLPVATAAVYRLARETYHSFAAPTHATAQLPPEDNAAQWLQWLRAQRNDLEPLVCQQYPEVRRTLAALRALPGCQLARMSGSGSACWAIFGTTAEAAQAAQQLQKAHPAWWITQHAHWAQTPATDTDSATGIATS